MIQSKTRIGVLQIGIIILTVATALVHLALGLGVNVGPGSGGGIDFMFLANAIGYLVLLGALYLPISQLAGYRSYIRWALVAFAVVTILGWVVMGLRIPIGYADKVIEIVLVVLLVTEAMQK